MVPGTTSDTWAAGQEIRAAPNDEIQSHAGRQRMTVRQCVRSRRSCAFAITSFTMTACVRRRSARARARGHGGSARSGPPPRPGCGSGCAAGGWTDRSARSHRRCVTDRATSTGTAGIPASAATSAIGRPRSTRSHRRRLPSTVSGALRSGTRTSRADGADAFSSSTPRPKALPLARSFDPACPVHGVTNLREWDS